MFMFMFTLTSPTPHFLRALRATSASSVFAFHAYGFNFPVFKNPCPT